MKIYNVLIFGFILSASSLVAAESVNNSESSMLENKACVKNQKIESSENYTYSPQDGYVPNEEVAIKIAVAVWEPIYGSKKIAQEKPYKVKLQNGVWFVSGSLKAGWKGGVAEIEICKTTAEVIRLSHGK